MKNIENADGASSASSAKELLDNPKQLLLGESRSKLCGGHECFKQRLFLAILCSLGLAVTYSFRCSIGVACGYFRSRFNATRATSLDANSTTKDLAVPWSASVIGAVESSYFWGYLITQLPGGIIANKLSATRAFGFATVISSVLNLLLPLTMSVNYGFTIAIRFLQGLAEGCTFPACFGIWRHWAPPQERSQLTNITFCGSNVGVFFSLLMSGWLSDTLGWPAPFYIYGGIGILWFAAWFLCTSGKPSEHPCISEAERAYIEDSIGENMDIASKSCNIPWKSFFTSLPVLAAIGIKIAHGWTFCLMTVEPTQFFSDAFHYNMTKSGFISALPHLVSSVVLPIGGFAADALATRHLSTTTVRKLFICVGFGMEALFLLLAGYSTDATVATVCLTLAVGFNAIAISGFNVNLLELAPRYASILMGIANCVGNAAGIFLPIATAHMVEDHSPESWSRVFLLASILHAVNVIVFAIFGSGEKQKWAEAPAEVENKSL